MIWDGRGAIVRAIFLLYEDRFGIVVKDDDFWISPENALKAHLDQQMRKSEKELLKTEQSTRFG